jgi:outer membrane protein
MAYRLLRKEKMAGDTKRELTGSVSFILLLCASLVLICLAGLAQARESWAGSPASALLDYASPERLERQVSPSPGKSWRTTDLSGYTQRLATEGKSPVDPRKTYSLSALIDLAERINPDTRIAWEAARQAAIKTGLVESQYLPMLTLSALGGYQTLPIPVSQSLAASGFYRVGFEDVAPMAKLQWLLLDFGRRSSSLAAAKEALLASNLGFNRTHQAVIFKVQRAYFGLTSLLSKIAVARSALDSARAVRESAEALAQHGLATVSDLSLARQQEAQAAFDLEDVRANERDAEVALADSMGISPTTPIKVGDFSTLRLPSTLEKSANEVIDQALVNRPDLIAKVAVLRAKEAEVRKARAAYYPTLSLVSDAALLAGNTRISDSRGINNSFSGSKPIYGIGLALEWDIFDGGAKRRRVDLAEAERCAAESEIEKARDSAIREVWKAYTDFALAERRLDVAAALVEASQKSYDTTMESYRNGLSTLIDLLAARRELTRARFVQVDTKLQLLNASATLAFSTGITNPEQQSDKGK